MNNFEVALGEKWNKYIAINEMMGSFMLISFIIIFLYFITKHKNNHFLIAFMIGIVFMVTTIITMVFGYFYGGSSNSVALLTPIAAILNGIIRGMYIGLPYIIGFQFIGALLGGAVTLLVLKGLGANLKLFCETAFNLDNSKISASLTKEVVMNLFVCLSIVSIPLFSWMNSTLDSTLALLILSLSVMLLLLITSKNKYFMFASTFSLIILMYRLVFNRPTKKEIINLSIAFGVHIIIPIIVGFIFYGLIHSGKVYYNLT
ncbi:MAG4940 family membrane protein [Mycoplasma marinum]|uniref:Uncharacterized protein n=1 Tax=Mycoplasma marinum TaxID=1937190 RepID=A0A4R0XRH9_9MOLU|nr:hypothetical protein [Mycoplasma marinum]TCG11010.1 hypothetical protein C4B24_03230 [Mycoplasma marinum]